MFDCRRIGENIVSMSTNKLRADMTRLFFTWRESPCDQISLDHSALLFLNGNLFNPLYTVGAGEKRSMINSLQKTGDWRCSEFIQIEVGPDFIDRYPALRFAFLFHEHFKKVRDISITSHERAPVAVHDVPAVSADTGISLDRKDSRRLPA